MSTATASTPKRSPSEASNPFSEPVVWPNITRETSEGKHTITTIDLWRKAGAPERHAARAAGCNGGEGKWGETYQTLCDRPDGSLIVLLGNRGTGKTQLAVALLAKFCREGKGGRYLKAMDLFRELRACYRKDGPSEVETVDKLCRLPLLVIDEAHERSDSEWENRTLTNIIDRRYDALRTTVLVSNMMREAFANSIGPSIVSRIIECGIVIECNWPSFRQKPGQ